MMRFGKLGAVGQVPLPRRVRNILAKYQATALIPGASGVAVHSFAPGNFVESTGQTLTPVDGAVGRVNDAGFGGINATQPTTQYKPMLRRGLVNLLTYSADFSNAVWNKVGSTSVGTLLSENTSTAVHGLARYATWPAAQQATVAARVKAGTATKVWIGNASAATACCFDILLGVVEGVIGSITGTIALDSDGFYVCTATHTAASSQTVLVGMYQTFVSGNYNSTVVFAGNTERNVTIHSAALFQGTVTAQQIIDAGGIPVTTTAPASSAVGPYFWRFDPIDDALLMTFHAGTGWDSTTIITGRATGQVTQTAQNVQGAHSITGGGDMYCRFYVPNGGNLSASELQAIQRFADRVAGVA